MKTLILALLLCVSAYAQTDLTDVGKIGIQTSTPTAIIDITGLPQPGAVKVVAIRNDETNAGAFGISHSVYDGSNGETRRDHVLCFGYNCQGPEYVNTEPELSFSIENRFKTAEGALQSEFYVTSGVPGTSSRPIAIDLFHANGATQVSVNSASFLVANPSQSNIWLRFITTDSSGDMTLSGNSGINYAGSREWVLSRYGLGMVGMLGSTSATQWNLFSGGITGETVNIFKNSSTGGNVPLTIKVGAEGHILQVGANGARWQMSGNYAGLSDIIAANDTDDAATPSTIVRRDSNGGIDGINIKINHTTIINQQCSFIANSDLSAADTARALNQLLGCLRDKNALIAPDSGP